METELSDIPTYSEWFLMASAVIYFILFCPKGGEVSTKHKENGTSA